MERERLAYPWATPPKVLGPLIIVVLIAVIAAVVIFAVMGRIQEAILACAVGGVFVLIAVLDMLSEVIRHQKLILEAMEKPRAAAYTSTAN